ncbi:MAG: M28 family metallopeptidase [Candidatus Poseidoniales archaeon]|nr:M28 family metallopeptidase [Candidatus Poseidoniales archaeon]|tara:strand:+ start:2039 stop:3757 length:1719 start_codon:yes stop_codon:yes gene_type:complete
MRSREVAAFSMVLILLLTPVGGCFSDSATAPTSSDLSIDAEVQDAGFFIDMTFRASKSMSVYIPYLLIDPVTMFVQNSTVIDLDKGGSETISILAPPRTDMMLFMIGEEGRENWPVRQQNESWVSWLARGGEDGKFPDAITRVLGENSTYDTVNATSDTGGEVAISTLSIMRGMSVGIEEGGVHSSGLLHGRLVYERLYEITDPANALDPVDGKAGYYDRWAGQGNPAYEDAAMYLISELEGMGLEVIQHRYEFTDIFRVQNPEAYNICAYKWGTEAINEWLVFGAHFDVAPPANAVLLDPHLTGSRSYGTRVGAYDNSAGTSMVLETAKVLANFESRRTMVFCLWSGEEGGKRGSDYWTEYYVAEDNPDVTVTNYINLDMAGVNWPGGGGAPHGDPDPEIDEDGYPKDSEVWPMRVYIGPSLDHDKVNQPGMVGLSNWIGSDALGLEEEIGTLVGVNYSADTWKTDVWLDMDRPEIIVYEDTTARSDHASFQDNLGTVTIGFGGLVDGYWCYHQTCDTLEEMEEWMDTTGKDYGEENTGVANLVNSLDMITWWALMTFFHCDEKPVLNAYL